jgi:multiple sugar transport system ATP-binding protein
MAEVRLTGVTKRFGETAAVADLTLAVADGELVVLLGPTGAGKTTTLRLVAGLEPLDAGRIEIAGQDVSTAPPAARDVAFVFQQYSLYPHYTVFDNLAFPLRSPRHRLPAAEIEIRVRQIAALLRIEGKLPNKATQLSGGEMQRVAIGRALVRSPTCFLMDEPLSSLDAKLREDLRVELKRIQHDLGATILYVTHDQVEAMTMADRIGVLEQGRLIQLGPPETVYARPDSIAVARRLGSPAINLLPRALLGNGAAPDAATIGVRPEDVRLDAADGALDGEVRQVEPLGADTVVLIDCGGELVHALIAGPVPVRPGSRTRLAFRPEGLIPFGQDGRRLET